MYILLLLYFLLYFPLLVLFFFFFKSFLVVLSLEGVPGTGVGIVVTVDECSSLGCSAVDSVFVSGTIGAVILDGGFSPG